MDIFKTEVCLRCFRRYRSPLTVQLLILALLVPGSLLDIPLLHGTDAQRLLAQTGDQSAGGTSRGYLTTPAELQVIAQKAEGGLEPYYSAVMHVLGWANREWSFELDEEARCRDANSPPWIDNDKGIAILYGKALAYHLTGRDEFAQDVKAILERIMSEVKTVSLDDQDCPLTFAWGTPELVASADLIEDYWSGMTCTGAANTVFGDTALTTGPCKRLFQNWLVKIPYFLVSLSAEQSQSNWGAAATNTLAYIADYLWDRPEVILIHRLPPQLMTNSTVLELAPADAYHHANDLALDRMNGYRVEYGSSSSCDYLAGSQQSDAWESIKSQITENGILPEDARREEFCNIPHYNGRYQNYPQIHLGHNIQQCELMLRRGDRSCYDNVARATVPNYSFTGPDRVTLTTQLNSGRGSIERAINAIIVDSATEWRHDSALEVAYRYYLVHHTQPGIEHWFRQLDRPSRCDQDICFGTLTHGLHEGEPAPDPPVAPPPPA